MQSENLDFQFGKARIPADIYDWEKNKQPISLCELDEDVGSTLAKLVRIANCTLLRKAARSKGYIWLMDELGKVWIAVEELALLPDGRELTGHPRRRDFPVHPAQEKKLGHPCLVDGKKARIAGELFMDEIDGKLKWHLNDNSGRYCKSNPPRRHQIGNILNHFNGILGCEIVLDEF